MNILLLAFALPVATILLAIVLQKVLRSPLLVAATFFAILLIVTYTAFDSSFLVFAILYTILAYVTAVLTRLICNIIDRFGLKLSGCGICDNNCRRNNRCNNSVATTNENANVSNASWICTTRNLASANSNQISNNALTNSDTTLVSNNSSAGNDPVIILTNANDITNGRTVRQNGCGCRRR